MFDHVLGINVAVHDLDTAVEKYERLFGVSCERIDADGFAFPGLLGARLELQGFQINLITSTEPGTSVAKFLERQGEGVFLLSVQVDDIDAAVETLDGRAVNMLFNPALKGDFGGVTFVHPRELHGVQLEVLQRA
jgi:methylmalonyl-CoA/ethylmalonyl-CoA epimerase